MAERISLQTGQFIDKDFGEWYDQGLPPHLAEQFPDGVQFPECLDTFEETIPNFDNVLTNVLVEAHQPRNDYHGITHAHRTVENAADGYECLQRIRQIKLPEGFLQAVLLGTGGHDHDHPGATFFADAEPDRIPAGAHAGMAVEWHSAKSISENVAASGGTPQQQLVAAYIPLSSAYGADETQGRQLGLERAAHPRGIAGRMMRAVDVLPAGGDYTAAVVEDTNIMYGERQVGGKRPPVTIEDYLGRRMGFLTGYVIPTMDTLDEAVKAPLTTHMGWRGRAEQRLEQVSSIRNGTSPILRAIIVSQISAKYGIQLA